MWDMWKNIWKEHTASSPYASTLNLYDIYFGKRKPFRQHIFIKMYLFILFLMYQIHTGEKPYKCNEENCNRAYAYQTDLKRHRRSVHGIITKTFACPICSKIFYENKFLTKHLNVHKTNVWAMLIYSSIFRFIILKAYSLNLLLFCLLVIFCCCFFFCSQINRIINWQLEKKMKMENPLVSVWVGKKSKQKQIFHVKWKSQLRCIRQHHNDGRI